jgi:hypothetical protein
MGYGKLQLGQLGFRARASRRSTFSTVQLVSQPLCPFFTLAQLLPQVRDKHSRCCNLLAGGGQN